MYIFFETKTPYQSTLQPCCEIWNKFCLWPFWTSKFGHHKWCPILEAKTLSPINSAALGTNLFCEVLGGRRSIFLLEGWSPSCCGLWNNFCRGHFESAPCWATSHKDCMFCRLVIPNGGVSHRIKHRPNGQVGRWTDGYKEIVNWG